MKTIIQIGFLMALTWPLLNPTAGAARVGIYKISPTLELYLVVQIDDDAKAIEQIIAANPNKKSLWSCGEQTLNCNESPETVSVCSQYGGKDSGPFTSRKGTPPLVELTCDILTDLRK
jgi:hypothetical protein